MSRKIHTMEVEEYLFECVNIDRSNIQGEFARVSADMAYWGEILAGLERDLATSKSDVEHCKARLSIDMRTQLERLAASKAAGKGKAPPRVTDSQVESKVVSHDQYRVATENQRRSDYQVKSAKGVLEAIRTKRDMLISLGAQMRAELKSEPYIKESEPFGSH